MATTPIVPDDNEPLWPVDVAGVRLRQMQTEDGPLLQALFDATPDYEQVFGDPGFADAVGTFIARPEGFDESAKLLIGGWRDGELVAAVDTILGYPNARCWTVGLLLVAATERRHGAGTAILDWLEAEAARHGASTIRLVIRASNEGGRRFAESRGYAIDPLVEMGSPLVLVKNQKTPGDN